VAGRVLSHVTVKPLLEARRRGATAADVSLDLGRTTTNVVLTPDGVQLADGGLGWDEIERVSRSQTASFEIAPDSGTGQLTAEPIKVFSEELGRLYTLYPTERSPTMLISGIPMHRIKGIDPIADTERKIAALRPIGGHVLDTATGLGYTAIALARAGAHVTTIELDPLVLELARRNPWSDGLTDQRRIDQRIGDAAELVGELPAAAFSAVLHDPPMFSLAGELYAAEFYRQLVRVLSPGGRLFHYVGNPVSPSGARTTKGVVRRLADAGFERVRPLPDAFGVVGIRPGGRAAR
jgi:predicted methyltransferase